MILLKIYTMLTSKQRQISEVSTTAHETSPEYMMFASKNLKEKSSDTRRAFFSTLTLVQPQLDKKNYEFYIMTRATVPVLLFLIVSLCVCVKVCAAHPTYLRQF